MREATKTVAHIVRCIIVNVMHRETTCLGYEKSCERWSPVQSVEKILLSVISMLAEPNPESPANVDGKSYASCYVMSLIAYRRPCSRLHYDVYVCMYVCMCVLHTQPRSSGERPVRNSLKEY